MTLLRVRKPEDEGINTLSSIFEDFFNDRFESVAYPKANIKETGKEFVIELLLAGFGKDDVELNIDKDILTVSSTKEVINNVEGERIIHKEFGYSSFERKFRIPEIVDTDKIEAKYDLGVLRIVLPKIESAVEKPARNIKIS